MQLFVLPVSKVGFEPAQNGLLYFFLEGILTCPPPPPPPKTNKKKTKKHTKKPFLLMHFLIRKINKYRKTSNFIHEHTTQR